MPKDLKATFEHLRRQRDLFEAVNHPKSISFRCKICGQRWRMRASPSDDFPSGPLEQMLDHADQHLFGNSLVRH